jgi:hypothetical protein
MKHYCLCGKTNFSSVTFIVEKFGSAFRNKFWHPDPNSQRVIYRSRAVRKDYADPDTVRQKDTDSYPGCFCIVCKTEHCKVLYTGLQKTVCSVIRNTLFLFVGSGENVKKEIKFIEAPQYLVNPNEALNLLYLPRNCLKYNSGIKCDVLPYLNRKLRRKYICLHINITMLLGRQKKSNNLLR